MSELQLPAMFCEIDDFCKQFAPIYHHHLLQTGHRRRQPELVLREIMPMLVYFHSSHSRHLVSYNRFVALMPRALVPLCCSGQTRQGRCTGIACSASTPWAGCHNRRIAPHKVFAGWATRGKTSLGWFYGFKRQLIVKDAGELWAFCLPPAQVDARRPVPTLVSGLFGQLCGDRGSIAQALPDARCAQGLERLTKIWKDRQNRRGGLWAKLLANGR